MDVTLTSGSGCKSEALEEDIKVLIVAVFIMAVKFGVWFKSILSNTAHLFSLLVCVTVTLPLVGSKMAYKN